jgi:hypothetical protein
VRSQKKLYLNEHSRILTGHPVYREDHKVVALEANKKPFLIIAEMGCPALGIWVAFLKQPDALPAKRPKKIKIIYF